MLHFPISTTGVLALLCVGDGTHVWLSNAACFLNKGQEVETGEKAPHAGSGYKRVDSSSCWMRRAQMAIPKEKGCSQESSPSGQPNGGQGTREQAADSGSSEQSSIPQKKKKRKGEGNSSERWPGSQNRGPPESGNSCSGGQRACPAQICAGSSPLAGAAAPTTPPQALPHQWWQYREPWAGSSRAGSAHSLHHPSMSQ